MSEPTRHLDAEIHELLDGRLDPAAEAEVRAHLAACEVCNDEFHRLKWLKERLRALPLSTGTPADLESMIQQTLAREESKPPTRSWLTAAVAASVMLAIAGGAAFWWWFHAPRPAEVGADYLSVAAGSLSVDHATSDPRDLQRYYAARGGVPAGVYDLGMMRYTLVGGRVHAHRGQPGTLTLYEGANGERLICEMYFAPPPSRAPEMRRTYNGIEFTVYRHQGVVMVFWDEGPVTCVLVASMDTEALLRIAYAKAGRSS
jgi:anti-sigma factor RsiW